MRVDKTREWLPTAAWRGLPDVRLDPCRHPTRGRRRHGAEKRHDKPKKDIWLRPLRND